MRTELWTHLARENTVGTSLGVFNTAQTVPGADSKFDYLHFARGGNTSWTPTWQTYMHLNATPHDR